MRQSSAALACAFLSLGAGADQSDPPLRDPVAEYARLAALPAAARCAGGSVETLPVSAAEGPVEASYDAAHGRLRALYRMNFKQLTEGWNWHPEAALEGGDYYRFKYLPLASVEEDRGADPGDQRSFAAWRPGGHWRHDYFFAFDNSADFYASGDDDAGFAADIAMPAGEAERLLRDGLRLALRGRLSADCLADSTTFYRATSDKLADFTLKKHYLIGIIEEVWFLDSASGRLLARVARGARRDAARTAPPTR